MLHLRGTARKSDPEMTPTSNAKSSLHHTSTPNPNCNGRFKQRKSEKLKKVEALLQTGDIDGAFDLMSNGKG